jgi:hypothetical protein
MTGDYLRKRIPAWKFDLFGQNTQPLARAKNERFR